MKKLCKNCTHFKNEQCTSKSKNAKNGYFNCPIFKAIPIADLIKERNVLLISKTNPERLEELTEKISNLNGGIV